jgi:hypothetical protein
MHRFSPRSSSSSPSSLFLKAPPDCMTQSGWLWASRPINTGSPARSASTKRDFLRVSQGFCWARESRPLADKTPLPASRGRREDVCVAANFSSPASAPNHIAAVSVRGPLFIIATDSLGSLLASPRGVHPPSYSRSAPRRGLCWSGESSICCCKARPCWLENCIEAWEKQARAYASARPWDM